MPGIKPTHESPAVPIPSLLEVTAEADGDNLDWPTGPGNNGGASDQWKQPVRVATTGTLTISTGLNAGDTIDGVTLVAGDRVLVKNQSSALQNGIYVAGATPARAADMDEDSEVLGAVVYVIAGTTNEATIWAVTNTTATVVGTDAINWAAFSGSTPVGDIDAVDVNYDNSETNPDVDNVQEALDDLYGLIGWTVDTPGTLTAGGSPQTVMNDATHNGFPGLCRLTPDSVLLVYPGDGTGHETGHSLCGQVGTLSATRDSATWGSKFTILNETEDLRCEDSVAVVERTDGSRQLVIAYRYYTGVGGDNHDPSILICDDGPEDFTSSSGWGSPIAIPLTAGSVQNYTQDRIQRLQDGTLILPMGYDSGGTHTVGVWRWTGDIEDIATGAFVTIGSGASDYAELDIEEMPDGLLRVHSRTAGGTSHYKAESADSGATWTSLTSVFTAEGFPMFRRLTSGLMLTVYRHSASPALGDTAWRQATDDTDTTWGSETILDSTGDHSIYGVALQITPYKILVVYGVESAYPPGADGDLYAQWFTDSSTFAPSFPEPIAVAHIADTVDAHDASAVSIVDAGGYFTATDVEGALQALGAGVVGAAAVGHAHVASETHLSDGATVTWTLDQMYEPGSVIAWNTTTIARLTVTEVLPDQATVSAAGTTGDKIVFDYAATLA